MEKYCFLNGKIVDIKNAKVSISDIGILRGFGVFDYLRTYNGKPFLLNRHLSRFERSADLIGLDLPYSHLEINNIIVSLLKKNKIKDAGVRLVLTGGESSDGLNWNKKTKTFFILIQKPHLYGMNMYEYGVSMITHPCQREIAAAKTNNYITRIILNEELIKNEAHEVLYTQDGKILEGATCNFFLFIKDKLITPKEDILFGTRRWLTLELAKKVFKIEERDIKLSELKKVTEAFITSTTRDIMPVTKIDGKKIGDGKVGPKTKKLMELYNNYIEKNK